MNCAYGKQCIITMLYTITSLLCLRATCNDRVLDSDYCIHGMMIFFALNNIPTSTRDHVGITNSHRVPVIPEYSLAKTKIMSLWCYGAYFAIWN